MKNDRGFGKTIPVSLTDKTLLVIEVRPEDAVHWMSPYDVDSDYLQNLPEKAKTAHPGGFQGVFADGTTRFFAMTMSPADRKAVSTIAGGETVKLP